jgi:hypothetical protein
MQSVAGPIATDEEKDSKEERRASVKVRVHDIEMQKGIQFISLFGQAQQT